jgi:hypothetical protein
VVWDCGDPALNTGETVSVPPPHTVSCAGTTSWSEACGGVTSICAAVGHVVSDPVGTSEYAMLKKAVAPGASITAEGAKLVNEKLPPLTT